MQNSFCELLPVGLAGQLTNHQDDAMTTIQLPDFDTLMKLARDNPAALEDLKQTATSALIERAPSQYQRRLRGIQFQVDMAVRRSKNPMDGCLRVSGMMHDSFGQLRGLLNDLAGTQPGYQSDAPTTIVPSAEILPFRA
jgi:hypothetical protein